MLRDSAVRTAEALLLTSERPIDKLLAHVRQTGVQTAPVVMAAEGRRADLPPALSIVLGAIKAAGYDVGARRIPQEMPRRPTSIVRPSIGRSRRPAIFRPRSATQKCWRRRSKAGAGLPMAMLSAAWRRLGMASAPTRTAWRLIKAAGPGDVAGALPTLRIVRNSGDAKVAAAEAPALSLAGAAARMTPRRSPR